MPEWRVREPPSDRVAHESLNAAAPAEVVRVHDPALQPGTISLDPLPDHLQPELVETAEHREIRR